MATAAALALVIPLGVAFAYWTPGSVAGGNGASAATSVSPGPTPDVTVSGADVALDWVPTSLVDGTAVTGYVVRRYDAATHTSQLLLTSCAEQQVSTACTETDVPPGRWRYTVTPTIGTSWTGAEGALSAVVATDTTAPINTITLSDVTGRALREGTTVYYRGAAAGSFTLSNTLTDTGSGPASSSTTALSGVTAGWTHTPSTTSTPVGGPFVSNPFSWTTGSAGDVTETVHGRDLAGNTAATTVSFVNDSTAPTGTAVSYVDGYQPAQSVVVTLTTGSDAGSGVAGRQLQRATSDIVAGGLCGVQGVFADVGPVNPTSPYTDTDVTDGSCYQYRYVVTDRVGNAITAVNANTAKVDAANGGPRLRSTTRYSVLAGTGVTNTLGTVISGDLGLSASGLIAGFPPGVVNGDTDDKSPAAAQAQVDLGLAYADAATRTPTDFFAGDQINATFHPGVHRTGAAFANTGTVTLDADGDSSAIFVFQINAAMDTAAGSAVALVDGARAANVYWQVNGAVTIGANATLAGTLMARGAITLGDSVALIGRALATGAVTMAANTIRFTTAPPPTLTIDGAGPGGSSDGTTDTTPTFTGTSDVTPGATVTVRVDEQVLTTQVTSDHTWAATAAALPAGPYQVVVSVRDASGNSSRAVQELTIEVNPEPVALATAGTYSLLSGVSITNSGTNTHLGGSAGTSPAGTITGLTAGDVDGTLQLNTPASAQALDDAAQAYADLDGRTLHHEITGVLGATTFRAGVYHSNAGLDLTGTVTLDAQHLPGRIFIFQGDAAMTTAALAEVRLINGAVAANVYFQFPGALSAGAGSHLQGTFLVGGAATLGANTDLTGRVLASGAVTASDNRVTAP